MAKFDLKSAYTHPGPPRSQMAVREGKLLGRHQATFGLRSAPMISNAVAEALAYVIRQKGLGNLDDFPLVAPPASTKCAENLRTALEVCEELEFQVAQEQTEEPAMIITLLGIEVDSECLELRLPQVKLREAVEKWRHRRACTKRDLQSLAGHLNHACKVIRAGRRFL